MRVNPLGRLVDFSTYEYCFPSLRTGDGNQSYCRLVVHTLKLAFYLTTVRLKAQDRFSGDYRPFCVTLVNNLMSFFSLPMRCFWEDKVVLKRGDLNDLPKA